MPNKNTEELCQQMRIVTTLERDIEVAGRTESQISEQPEIVRNLLISLLKEYQYLAFLYTEHSAGKEGAICTYQKAISICDTWKSHFAEDIQFQYRSARSYLLAAEGLFSLQGEVTGIRKILDKGVICAEYVCRHTPTEDYYWNLFWSYISAGMLYQHSGDRYVDACHHYTKAFILYENTHFLRTDNTAVASLISQLKESGNTGLLKF